MGKLICTLLLHLTVDTNDLSQNSHVLFIKRFHRIIFRLQANAVLFAEKALYGRRIIIDKSNHDIIVISCVLLPHENVIAIKDAGVDHALALDP